MKFLVVVIEILKFYPTKTKLCYFNIDITYFRFDLHIQKITGKIFQLGVIICVLGYILPFTTLKMLFFNLVYPSLGLHTLAWGDSSVASDRILNIAFNNKIRNMNSSNILHSVLFIE